MCTIFLSLLCSLNPSTLQVLALIREVVELENGKEHLKVNLLKAEDEVICTRRKYSLISSATLILTKHCTQVNLLFEANGVLDEENKRLLRQLQREKHTPGSGGKQSSNDSTKVSHISGECVCFNAHGN